MKYFVSKNKKEVLDVAGHEPKNPKLLTGKNGWFAVEITDINFYADGSKGQVVEKLPKQFER